MYDGIEVIRRTLLLCIIFEELQLRAETWLSFSFQKYLLISEIYLESKNLSQQINCYYNLLKTTFPYAAIYWIHVKLSAPICTTLLSNAATGFDTTNFYFLDKLDSPEKEEGGLWDNAPFTFFEIVLCQGYFPWISLCFFLQGTQNFFVPVTPGISSGHCNCSQ